MGLYIPPDIRQQTIADAEAFLSAKRARRMITLMTYKELRADKLNKIKGDELIRFTKQSEKVDKISARIEEDLYKLKLAIANLAKTHNNIANIESEERLL